MKIRKALAVAELGCIIEIFGGIGTLPLPKLNSQPLQVVISG